VEANGRPMPSGHENPTLLAGDSVEVIAASVDLARVPFSRLTSLVGSSGKLGIGQSLSRLTGKTSFTTSPGLETLVTAEIGRHLSQFDVAVAVDAESSLTELLSACSVAECCGSQVGEQ